MKSALTLDAINSSRQLGEMNLRDLISTLASLLPTQGAITEFIHHNTLHAFQSLSFGDAIIEAGKIYGAKIDPSGALKAPTGILVEGIRAARAKRLGYDIDERLQSFMIRIGSSFFDQGLSPATLPSRADGLWNAARKLSQDSFIPIPELSSKRARSLFALAPRDAIDQLLSGLLGENSLRPRYLAEVLMSLKGWAGLCRIIETGECTVEHGSSARLEDWIALYLLVEWNLLCKIFDPTNFRVDSFARSPLEDCRYDGRKLEQDLFEAEEKAYSRILKFLAKVKPPTQSLQATAQAIFCIDDREFSMRRYLEDLNTGVHTYGAAGFFGLDIKLKEPKKGQVTKLCPPAVTPGFTVSVSEEEPASSLIHDLFWSSGSSSLWNGWFVTQLVGIPSGLRFLATILFPHRFGKRRLEHDILKTAEIQAFQTEFVSESYDAKSEGMSVEQAADHVKGLLDTIGFPHEYAPIVAVVGHGASSTNNPYFAAYDCGACSGRPGTINARVFAKFANDPAVREKLAQLGRVIPAESRFIPILHDTTVDIFDVLDRSGMSLYQEDRLKRFEQDLATAAGLNAVRRCRQFQSAKASLSPREALKHVSVRASAWFEARPEYNHATNIAAIIGPSFVYPKP